MPRLVPVAAVARVLRAYERRPVRPSTVARALADEFEPYGVDRADFLAAAGAVRAVPNQRRETNEDEAA